MRWSGGFIAGAAGTLVQTITSLPGFAVRAIYEICSLQLINDIINWAKGQYSTLVNSFDQLQDMKPYDQGNLFGTLIVSAILAVLALIGAGKAIAGLVSKIAQAARKQKNAAVLARVLTTEKPPTADPMSVIKKALSRRR